MQKSHELEKLEKLGFLRRDGSPEPAYLFKHILIQETMYASLLRQDRRRVHRLIGDCLEALGENEAESLVTLAQHFAEAGENQRAYDCLKRYGEHAARLSAYPEAVEAYERALALIPSEEPSQQAQVAIKLGDIFCRYTNFALANENYRAALEQAQRADDALMTAAALSGLARVASQQGEHLRARELGEQALKSAQEAGDQEAIARAHRQLGVSYNFESNNDLARAHLNAALGLSRALGDLDGMGNALNSLGVIAREQQEPELAQKYFQDALALSEQSGDKYAIGIRLGNLGVLAEQRGDFEQATRYQERARALADEIGDREGAALYEMNLGSLAQSRGELEQAQRHLKHALAELIALDSISFALYAVAAYAKLNAAQGDTGRSAELLGLALSHPASTGDIEVDFASLRKELESKLGEQEFDAALAIGAAMELSAAARKIYES